MAPGFCPGLRVLEVRVAALVQLAAHVPPQGRDPIAVVGIDPPGQFDEDIQIRGGLDAAHANGHCRFLSTIPPWGWRDSSTNCDTGSRKKKAACLGFPILG